MAETISIEIPVSVNDNTDSGISNIKNKLSALEKAAQKVSKILLGSSGTRGIEQTAGRMEKTLGGKHAIEIDAEDNATPVLSEIENAASRVDRISADVDIGADNNAQMEISNVEDSAAGLDGTSSEVELNAADNATLGIANTKDAAAELDGMDVLVDLCVDDAEAAEIDELSNLISTVDGETATVYLDVDDAASEIIASAEDATAMLDGSDSIVYLSASDGATQEISGVEDSAASLDGTSANVTLGAEDNATPVIDSVIDKASEFDGSEYSATLSLNEAGNAAASSAASTATSTIAGAAGAAGLSFGLYDAVNNFKDFESTMSEVQALSDASSEQMAILSEKAKQMGADTKYSALESAQAFTYMAQAGWDTQSMVDGIGGIMSLAASDGIDLASATDIVANALTAFGLSASDTAHFADVLAEAGAASNTNVTEMGEAFKYVSPVAGTLGYEIEDVALALGIMSNNGIKGSQAGTTLRSALSNLAAPTDKMATAMEKYGISLTDSEGNMKSLREVMDNVRSSLGGLSESEQAAAATTIFGDQAMSGMLAIVNASQEAYDELADSIDNSTGAADRMAATMMDNLAGSLELLSGEWDETQRSLGERMSPYIESAAGAIENALPGIRDKMNSIFDSIDQRVEAMTSSSAWIDADFIGKVDIAWDTLIGEPFMDWVTGDGKNLITSGISSLFTSAAKILPGGEKAGLSSWLSAAVIGKGTLSAVSGIQKLSSAVESLIPGWGQYALVAGAAAAAVTAVGVAVDAYNQKQINTSLEEHFGNVELSADQISDFVDQMIDVEFTANVELALGEFNNADEMRKEAEAALADNDALEWKCSVGMTLSEDEQESYSSNIETFIESKKSELEEQFSAVSLAINTVIDEQNSSSMISTVSEWFSQDQEQLDGLSSQLSEAVSEALTDGIVSADEQEAINALQEKINSILSSWNESKSQTQLDMIKQKYGHLTAADLESGTFEEIVASYQEQRETQEAELDSLSERYYGSVNSAMNAGRLTADQADEWKEDWQQGNLNKQGSSLADALSFEGNTLRDTYGTEISGNLADSEKWVNKGIKNQMNPLFANGTENVNLADFQDYLNAGVTNQMGNASGALKSLYESMEPDVSAMEEVIDRYREEFGYVPENLKEAYDDAIEVGAAAGNEDAAMEMYAKSLLENGSDELVSALTDPNNELYEAIRGVEPELAEAIDRELAETGEGIEIDDLTARLEDLKVDDSGAQQSVEEALTAFEESIANSGSQTEITADGLQVTLGEVEVDGQSALEQVAEAVNMTADELAQANGYTSAVEVETGATITVPADNITFDTSALQSATQEAASETETDPIENETTANTTVAAGETDASQVEEQAQSDTEEAVQDMDVEGSADVDITQTNNAADVYNEVDAALRTAFATTIPVSANASITVNYSLANPSATISFGGGGSGSATVTAAVSAEGRYVDGPLLSWIGEDGPEFVIPVGEKRKSRGIELWEQAGRALGVSAYADGGLVGGAVSDGNADSDWSNDKTNSEDAADKVSTSINTEKSGVVVQVSLSPQFTIADTNENSVVQLIRTHLKELADELGGEIAVMISEAYENTPVTT